MTFLPIDEPYAIVRTSNPTGAARMTTMIRQQLLAAPAWTPLTVDDVAGMTGAPVTP